VRRGDFEVLGAMKMEKLSNAGIIGKMKGLPDGAGARFPIRDRDMGTIGFLSVFDNFRLNDAGLIAAMARARTSFKEFFMTRFDVTPENKRYWLEHSVLGNDRKVIFLVETLDGRIVGQDGITLLGTDTFMLDGTMRWARGGRHGLFERSIFERASMGFVLFGCDLCNVDVFKKNKWSIFNLESMGLVIQREFSLSRAGYGGKTIF
jgi:hypothetical protein